MDVSSVSGVVVLDELGGVVIFAGFEVVIILAFSSSLSLSPFGYLLRLRRAVIW